MWARMIEFALGLWLAMSPFIFGHPYDATLLWTNDFACALAIAIISLASFKRAWPRLHLLNIVVALWLIGVGFIAQAPPPPAAYQNYVCVGLLLGMFAIIPSHAGVPPRSWRHYFAEQR